MNFILFGFYCLKLEYKNQTILLLRAIWVLSSTWFGILLGIGVEICFFFLFLFLFLFLFFCFCFFVFRSSNYMSIFIEIGQLYIVLLGMMCKYLACFQILFRAKQNFFSNNSETDLSLLSKSKCYCENLICEKGFLSWCCS